MIYPVDPITSIIGELKSRVVEEFRFENRIDVQECGLEICHGSGEGFLN